MSYRKIHKVSEGTLTAAGSPYNTNFTPIGTAAELNHRLRHDHGFFLIEFDGNPNVANGSLLFLQSKVFPADQWGHVFLPSGDRVELDLFANPPVSPEWNGYYVGFPLMPRVRWKFRNFVVGSTVDYKAWVML